MRFKKSLLGALAVGIFLPVIVLAAMSSTNYYIYADSLDFGGGLGTSTDNNLQGSIGGEVSPGISTSTSYQVNAGFQAMVRGALSLNLSSNNIDFGSMNTVGTVVSSATNATVDTDSATGYTLSVDNVSGDFLAAVTDGVVDGAGGSGEEYGLAVSGNHADYAGDAAVVNNLILSHFNLPVTSDVTNLTFKAVRGSSSVAKTYNQSISLTAAANP